MATPTQDQINAAVKSLSQTLATLTKQTEAQVLPFATEFGTAAAIWGANLAAAKQANDAESIAKYEEDFKYLADDAVLEAADYAIQGEAAGEQTVIALLRITGNFAANLAVAAVA